MNDSWYNQPWFNAVATVLTGFVAYYLYSKSKRDEVRSTARLILADLRETQKAFNRLSINQEEDMNVIMSDSWSVHRHVLARKHLFIDRLTELEFEHLNNHFLLCHEVQGLLNSRSLLRQKSLLVKAELFQEELMKFYTQCNSHFEIGTPSELGIVTAKRIIFNKTMDPALADSSEFNAAKHVAVGQKLAQYNPVQVEMVAKKLEKISKSIL